MSMPISEITTAAEMIGKSEWTRAEANPRFVVTSLKQREITARSLYEQVYCARGDMDICQA